MLRYAITTVDNPFDPIDQFDEWLEYDNRLGYGTIDLLGRLVITSSELSDADKHLADLEAIDVIIDMHPEGPWKKVEREEA